MSKPPPRSKDQPSSLLDGFLSTCTSLRASDLHLSSGDRPMIRVDGELAAMGDRTPLNEAQLEQIAQELIGDAEADWRRGSIDGACFGPDGSRFRFNLFRRQGLLAVAIRRLENRFRALSDLGLPDSLYGLADLRDGLIIVSGPTGAGKSTTLATLLDRINTSRACHIVTIEDPIEYVHRPVRSLIHQRQVGLDAPTFNDALIAALRQDPDVILVGEVRDLATIRTAIIAAQTGHLVFATLHSGDCVQAVERLVSVFSKEEQDAVRRQLALVLRAVVTQHLLPRGRRGEEGTSRIPACEILMATAAASNLIASGKSGQLYSVMESGSSAGMQTLEQDLSRLWVAGEINEQTAYSCARDVVALQERAALLRQKKEDGAVTMRANRI